MIDEKIADEIQEKATELRSICVENDIPLVIGMMIIEGVVTILMPCDTETTDILLERMKELNIENAKFWKENKASDEKPKEASNE